MDHASMEQDRQDLARYRAGLAPIQRKEITLPAARIMLPEKVVEDALQLLLKRVAWTKKP